MIFDLLELIYYLLVPAYRRKKQKADEWIGRVEEKTVKSDFSLGKFKCVVVFRKTDGSSIKLKVPESVFSRYEEGKQYRKPRGEIYPIPFSG